MALTSRSNGSTSANIAQASWWNDFMNLLTGVMADQPVTINNGVTLKAVSTSALVAPTLALAAGTALGIGAYTYAIGFVMGNGRSIPGPTAPITTTTGNQDVTVSGIPLGPAGTSARIVWRSKVGTTSPLYQAVFIGDNTTTSTTDTTPDASLTTLAPTHDSFGGTLFIQDSGAVRRATLYDDGSVYFDSGAIQSSGNGMLASGDSITINGRASGTMTLTQLFNGSGLKLVQVSYNNFKNGGAAQSIAIPTPFSTFCSFIAANQPVFNLVAGGVAQTVTVYTGLSSSGNTTSTLTALQTNAFGFAQAAIDTVTDPGSSSVAHTGSILLWGF